MKKSLLALAILGAFAGAASAQSSVTIYGLVDESVSSIDNGIDRVNGLDSGNNGASRIGFKGTEDLGNGMKAHFVLENGINVDDGTGGAGFSRLAFAGLSGAFGTVRLGRQQTTMKELMGHIDPFGAAGIANGHDFVNGGITQRAPNMISYLSNDFGGFSGEATYQFGETKGDNTANSGYGLRLGYKNGPLDVQFSYNKENSTDVIDNATAGTDQGTVDPAGDDLDNKNALLGATYNFGAFKLHGLYGERKQDVAGGGDYKLRTGLVGVTVPFGASKIRAEYIRLDNRDVDNADSDVFALSYMYSLSKRTALYATYVDVSNDNGASLGIGGALDDGAASGQDANAFAVGVSHKF